MGWAGAIMAVGMAVSAYSQGKQGVDNKEYYNYLATEDEKYIPEIQKTARQQTGLIYDSAARTTEQSRKDIYSNIASQKAALAGNNISLSSKTAEDIARSTANVEAQDEMAIRYNADLSAWQVNKEAANTISKLKSESQAYKMSGDNALTSGILNGVSSLFSSAKLFAK
jgi:hypothetical protein